MALASVATFQANAQNYDYYKFTNQVWQDPYYGEDYSPVGVFYKCSANGKYAVGYDGVLYSGLCYYWENTNPEGLTYIHDAINRVMLCDVSNDGVMVGAFEERDMEDWETECQCLPGFYTKDGGWKQLPVPENYSVYYSTTNSFLTNAANVITPDGKYIAGQLDVTTGYKEVSGLGLLEKTSTVPVLWEKSDTGYVLKEVYTDLWKDSKRLVDGELVTITDSVSFQTFIVWDISDDGQTLVGVNTAGSGGQNPAIIRDGVMIQLFECGEEDAADDTKNFNGGICKTVDAQGNIYGYYVEADGDVKNFKFTKDNQMVYLGSLISCVTGDGKEIPQSYNNLPYVLDCSADGTLIVGGDLLVLDFGMANEPALLWDMNAADAIAAAKANEDNVSIDYRRGGQLYVNGVYDEAAVYDAAGRMIASGKQGKAFNLGNCPTGVYIVKVSTAKGSESFKISK